MSPSATLRKPLGIRATPEEHERITQAAQREHRSVNSFVLHAALQAAKAQPQPKPKRSREEILAILADFRHAVQEKVGKDRDILAEFLADRHAEAEND
jgi:Protein of unknown function (DUF1778)